MVISKKSRTPLIILCIFLLIVTLCYVVFSKDSGVQKVKITFSIIALILLLVYGYTRNNEYYYASDEGFLYKDKLITWDKFLKIGETNSQRRHDCKLYLEDGSFITFVWNKNAVNYISKFIKS